MRSPLGLQLGRAARHEHLQPGRQAVHPVVQGVHRPAFGGVLPGPRRRARRCSARARAGGLGEGGGEGLLHDRHRVGELERLRAGVLAGHDGLEVPVRPHELPGGGEVLGDAVQVAVQVHAEQVERVPAGLGDVVEELPRRAAGLAAEHVVAAAAEDDRRGRVGLLDRAVHGLQLLDVLGRGARPEQAGVARLVVALPVADPAAPAWSTQCRTTWRTNSAYARWSRAGEGGRKSVGCRVPHGELEHSVIQSSSSPSAGRAGRPPCPSGTGRAPVRPAPSTGRPATRPAPSARACGTNSPGRAEQAVADAAHHAEPDSPGWSWFERESFTHKLVVYIVNSDRAQTYYRAGPAHLDPASAAAAAAVPGPGGDRGRRDRRSPTRPAPAR